MPELDEMPVIVEPLAPFLPARDLVTDVSLDRAVAKHTRNLQPPPDFPGGGFRMAPADSERVQSSGSASSASCARMSATCCATTQARGARRAAPLLSTPRRSRPTRSTPPTGWPIRASRTASAAATSPGRRTRVRPEEIAITDNGIIPRKERAVDRFHHRPARRFRVAAGG